MKVHGEEIPEHLIDHALASMDVKRGFTLGNLEGALCRAGVPHEGGVAMRCADRTLQKLRRKGSIAFDGRVWKVAA